MPLITMQSWLCRFDHHYEIESSNSASLLPQFGESFYRSLVNSIPYCVLCKDSKGRIIFGNVKLWETLGRGPDEVLGKTDFDLFPRELAEKYRRDDLYVMSNHEPFETIEAFLAPDSKVPRTIRSVKTPFYDAHERPAGIQIIFTDITDALAQNEQLRLLSRAVEQSPVSILVTDPNGVIEYVNPRFTQVTGYTAQDVIGKKPSLLKSGHTMPGEYAQLWKTIKAGEVWRGEFLNRKKDGTLYWEAASISPVLSEEGQITHFVGVREDISDLRQIEQSLRRQNEYLDALHETTLGLMGRLQLSELLQAITQRAASLAGTANAYIYLLDRERDEMAMSLGIGVFGQMVGSQAQKGRGLTGNVWQTGETLVVKDYQTWKGRLEKPGVEQLHALVCLPIKSDGRTVGVFGLAYTDPSLAFDEPAVQILTRFANLTSVALDNARLYAEAQEEIAQRWLANAQLRESEQQLRHLFEASPDAILLIDPHAPDGTWPILDCNEVACRMNGYTRDELVGSSIDILNLQVGTVTERNAYLERARREGAMQFETHHRHRDGHIFPIETSTSILYVGKRELILGIDRDITERKQIERIKNEFISTVSHELRTPLTSIRGSLGLIAGGVAGTLPERAKTMIDIAYKNSERLVRLINDILDIEKIESGKMVFELQPLPIMPLIEGVLEANRGYAEQFHVSLVLAQALPDAIIQTNADRLNQVLTNLISNACKFSPPGSNVEIRVLRNGDMIQVAVCDHGPGIPAEFQARLFQKFAQADGSGTRQTGGSGLGLSIAKAIVENMRGTIGFDTTPGEGTIFYFQIPGRVPRSSAVTIPPPHSRILICEDDPDIAGLLDLLLKSGGFETDVALDAASARVLLAKNHYAALTLDLVLPDADGIALIRELRGSPATRDLPIVVVSATAQEGRAILDGDAVWVADWLRKPIDRQQLLHAVTTAAQPAQNLKPHILHVEADTDVQLVVSAVLGDTATVTAVNNSKDARTLLQSQTFDLMILDSGMPDGSGIDLLPLLSRGTRQIPVVIFSDGSREPNLLHQVGSVLVKSKASNEQLLNTITNLIQQQNRKAVIA